MEIPERWTFKSSNIAENFQEHVSEQLPWYPIMSSMVTQIATSYLQDDGVLVDLGCSLGEVTKRLDAVIKERCISAFSFDSSQEMIDRFLGCGDVKKLNIEHTNNIPNFNVCTVILTLMFTKYDLREKILKSLIEKCSYGGCVIVVDKVQLPGGYIGQTLNRMTMSNKMLSGVSCEEIIKKELSLMGAQIPSKEYLFESLGFIKWFQVGDFCGYIYVKE